jgi:uncharacterized membrane protein
MTKRALMALVALLGVFLAAYLTLFKLGIIGTVACGAGSCETVQLSRWGMLFGIPVAAWGLGYYVTVLALALVGVQERWEDSRGFSVALVVLTGWGALFSAWLTALEAFVIDAWCRWCVVSAMLALLLFVLALLDWREVRAAEAVEDEQVA